MEVVQYIVEPPSPRSNAQVKLENKSDSSKEVLNHMGKSSRSIDVLLKGAPSCPSRCVARTMSGPRKSLLDLVEECDKFAPLVKQVGVDADTQLVSHTIQNHLASTTRSPQATITSTS